MTTSTSKIQLASAKSQPELIGEIDLNINENGTPCMIHGGDTPMGSIREEIMDEEKD